MSLLEVRDVTRSFYVVHALNGVDINVETGKITGLIGPNGAGKTTLFNCIAGLVPADGGVIRFDGVDITHMRPDQVTRRGLIKTFQIARGFPRLTVLENLLLYAPDQPGEEVMAALMRSRKALAREQQIMARAVDIARMLNLTRVLDEKASDLSGGQKKLLEIGRALMSRPKLILLDEPAAGVNPTLIREIGERLRMIVASGITLLLIEHQMDLIARLCDHVIVLAEGRRLVEGSFEDVANNPNVQQAYMGRRR